MKIPPSPPANMWNAANKVFPKTLYSDRKVNQFLYEGSEMMPKITGVMRLIEIRTVANTLMARMMTMILRGSLNIQLTIKPIRMGGTTSEVSLGAFSTRCEK
jgi:hypothetical protein